MHRLPANISALLRLAQNGRLQSPLRQFSTASFGSEDVAASEKAGRVGAVFSSVAPSYDLMNDLMSAGLHRLWKGWLVEQLAPFPGMHHLDVAGGTGDVATRVARDILAQSPDPEAEQGSVVVCDINPDMLAEGQRRLDPSAPEAALMEWMTADAEALPLQDDSVDGYTVAFGVRNMTNIDAALREAHRVLRPGGQFLCLEFSPRTNPALQRLYDAYSHHVIPQIGRVVANDEQSYKYLVESIRRFPDPDLFRDMIWDAGFRRVRAQSLTGGIVYLHSGFKS
ncbi:hypothetical protein WJX73_001655 [Symbiochloris irregularis]|uniref:2-methoxy-6-polyprenyl-1,4-benzoquinol methylase, mitochondrial n=1 Tax=Symbiochloris irregularis TaxID=706552 RepID=A0AAW1P2M4_9CHLO